MRDRYYGYKICYKEIAGKKLKLYLVTNTYDSAKWDVEWYQKHPPHDRKDNHQLRDPTWYIYPVKTYFEYSKLWRGCPFRDYLSDFIKRSKQ